MELLDFINKYKNKIINIAVITLAFIIAKNIYQSQTKTVVLLKENRVAEMNKAELLTSIAQIEKKINLYKRFLNNKKDISSVINTIVNIAKDTNIKIVSLKPEKELDLDFYTKYPFHLNIEIDSYHTLGRFISKLESHADIYILEQITIRQMRTQTQGEMGNNKLIANLTLTTIVYKD